MLKAIFLLAVSLMTAYKYVILIYTSVVASYILTYILKHSIKKSLRISNVYYTSSSNVCNIRDIDEKFYTFRAALCAYDRSKQIAL